MHFIPHKTAETDQGTTLEAIQDIATDQRSTIKFHEDNAYMNVMACSSHFIKKDKLKAFVADVTADKKKLKSEFEVRMLFT